MKENNLRQATRIYGKILAFFFIALGSMAMICAKPPSSIVYRPFTVQESGDYKIDATSLAEQWDSNLTIWTYGSVHFIKKTIFVSKFTFEVANTSNDTVLIAYADIKAFCLGRNIEKAFYVGDRKIDTAKEPVWKIAPGRVAVRKTDFFVPSKNTRVDRHHEITVLIEGIRKIPSGVFLQFKARFWADAPYPML